MSNQNHTHITVILDRSGSMESIRDATIAGFNAFLEAQRSVPGKATLSLVQFDSQDAYEVVHRFRSIQEVPDLTRDTFVPRDGTPLLDALGRGINDLEQRLSALADVDRPARAIIAIITDGAENASREFTKAMIVDRIAAKRKDGWQFVFLSADLEAINEAVGHTRVAASACRSRAESGRRGSVQNRWCAVAGRIARQCGGGRAGAEA